MVTIVWFVGFLYTLISLFLHHTASIKRDVFHPVVLYKVIFIVGFWFCGILLLKEGTIEKIVLLETFFVGLLSVIMLDLGALFIRGNFSTKKMYVKNEQNELISNNFLIVKLFIILYLCNWLWRIYALKSGWLYGTHVGTYLEVSKISNIIGTLNNLGWFFFVGILVYSRINKWSYMLIFGLFEFIWLFLSGSKSSVINLLLVLLLTYHLRSRVIKFNKLVKWFILFMPLIVSVFYFANLYRMLARINLLSGGSMKLTDTIKLMFSENQYSYSIDMILNNMLDRVNLAKSVALLIQAMNVSNIEYWLGKSYIAIFVWFIPRIIWPNKPTVSVGYWYGKEVLGWSYNARSEGAITLMGDAYLNFGYVGVIFIMFLVGWLISAIYSNLRKKGDFGLFILLSIYPRMLMGIEQNLSNVLVYISQSFVLITFVYFFVKFIKQILSKDIYVDQNISQS